MDVASDVKRGKLGRQVATRFSPRLDFSSRLQGWLGIANDKTVWNAFMKKPTRPDHPSETSRRSSGQCRSEGAKDGRWSFNLATENLFALGSTENARRVAYRTANGELRFLPI